MTNPSQGVTKAYHRQDVGITGQANPGQPLSLDVHLPRLREQRLRRALSQEELAKLTGLSRTTIIKIEGGRNAWPKTHRKLAQALRVKPEDLT